MELEPVIASYTGETYRAIRAYLTAEVLRLIARIAETPVPVAELDRRSYLLRPDAAGDSPGYVAALNAHLTDVYAALLAGTQDDAALRSASERVGLWRDGAPAAPMITQEAMARYAPTVDAVSAITASYFADKMGTMRALLASSTGGRQGVPPENMMLNLWRYVRRSIARGLYAEGILTDRLPETGLTTLFYANDVAMLARLLG